MNKPKYKSISEVFKKEGSFTLKDFAEKHDFNYSTFTGVINRWFNGIERVKGVPRGKSASIIALVESTLRELIP